MRHKYLHLKGLTPNQVLANMKEVLGAMPF